MYNEELKARFTNEYSVDIDSRRVELCKLFNRLAKYEELYGRDFCQFDHNMLVECVGELVGFREISKRKIALLLREYVKWCLENNVEDATDRIFHIDIQKLGVDKLKRQTLANPQHLARFMDYLYADPALESADCIHRGYCWLAYSGMEEEQALRVTTDDVDLTYRVIRIDGYEYPIYQEAVETILKCMKCKQFLYRNPNNMSKISYRDRANNNILLRSTSETVRPTTFRVELSSRQNERRKQPSTKDVEDLKNMQLSYFRIQMSGMFYRQYEIERSGREADFAEAASIYVDKRDYKLDKTWDTLKSRKRKLAKSYMKDYEMWKEAYSI